MRDQDQSVIATTSLENVGGADFGWLTEMHDGLDAFDIHIPSDANDEEIDATWREYLDDSDDYMCVLAFTFEDIPSADFYELQIGSALSSFGFSRDELEADGYFLPLVVD